jgi:hypothetical protein
MDDFVRGREALEALIFKIPRTLRLQLRIRGGSCLGGRNPGPKCDLYLKTLGDMVPTSDNTQQHTVLQPRLPWLNWATSKALRQQPGTLCRRVEPRGGALRSLCSGAHVSGDSCLATHISMQSLPDPCSGKNLPSHPQPEAESSARPRKLGLRAEPGVLRGSYLSHSVPEPSDLEVSIFR